MNPFISCKELVDFLAAYLEDELEPARRSEFDRHMAVCPSCIHYVETYKATILMGKAALCGPDDAVPADVPEELVNAILAARKKPAG
jgi:anti-sigma factor RsiW